MSRRPLPDTPMLDELESGPWPSFVTGLKRLAKDNDMMVDLMGQLETSYETRKGYWKGGTVGVFGYGGGIIPRFTELKDETGKPLFPEAAEFHTLRVQPPAGMHYTSDLLRKLCDVWIDNGGSGLIAFHGQSGDIMFQGVSSENVQAVFNGLNEIGFDLGGAGPALRTSMSCVGSARCEMSCFDEARALRTVINNNLDDMHRPSLPYKFKFKFSGCPNDCVNAIQRSDMATIGTWRDNIRVDEALVQDYYKVHGMHDLYNDVVGRCPTKAITVVPSDQFKARRACLCCQPGRRQHPVHRQQKLRALHALPQRHPRRPAARQGQGRVHPGGRQGRAEDRRHHGQRDHPVHEAGDRRGLRKA